MPAFIKILGRIPFVGQSLRPFADLEHSFWTPPLSPSLAYRLEADQIETAFNLPALVSLTDHDNIQAGEALRTLDPHESYPISVEWTLPYESTFFYLGVHNLPPEMATEWMSAMLRYTADPNSIRLGTLLEALNENPNVLLVAHHPLWDKCGIGCPDHEGILSTLIQAIGPHLHALEVNGTRPIRENMRVLRYGEQIGLPVVAGGDRHGCEPNAIINLTAATSFDEFAAEIRETRRSHIVYMPQYRKALPWRSAGVLHDVLRSYPGWPEDRRCWDQRIFLQAGSDNTSTPFCDLRHRTNHLASLEFLDLIAQLMQVKPIEAVLSKLLSRNPGTLTDELQPQKRSQIKRKSKAQTAA